MATPGPNGLNRVNGLNGLNCNHVPPPPPDSLDDEDDAIESLNSIIQRYKDLMRVSTSELKTLVTITCEMSIRSLIRGPNAMTLPQARHYFINNYLRYVRKRISIGLWIKYMERRAEELPEARDNINRVLDVTREVAEGYDEYTDANCDYAKKSNSNESGLQPQGKHDRTC
ncbi:hypothetical protein SAPIO_CDS2956 [Scedosporium apiospermum]|uniref:Uncharacterized protein n=1 Tax=Pseudallescheria apiosperma TaxID=563466 RepID=A0A084GBX3_PSEDA|nr:uncharacterized protein SAPIO_CDS2956 [Scedosporium apiospermum]KEZ44835.1 hypothetical protein SAPIO_CDS2956 [Scedosporium apiospermum]